MSIPSPTSGCGPCFRAGVRARLCPESWGSKMRVFIVAISLVAWLGTGAIAWSNSVQPRTGQDSAGADAATVRTQLRDGVQKLQSGDMAGARDALLPVVSAAQFSSMSPQEQL